ncbi:MAG: hypothetical protein U0270_18325 [Labilithrix sp.]
MTTKPPPYEPFNFADAVTDPQSVGQALRAVMAGNAASSAIASSVALFQAGGKLVLNEGTQTAVRSVAEKGAEKALLIAAGPLLGPAQALVQKPVSLLAKGASITKQIAPAAAKSASKEILKGAGRAAGIGFVIDGAVAGVEAVVAVRNGKLDAKKAAAYVATEATTGAIATGAGMLLGAGLVALTGGVAAPVVFAVGALGSIGAKRMLRKITLRPEKVEVREVPQMEAAAT